jgi:hypothetical protein
MFFAMTLSKDESQRHPINPVHAPILSRFIFST